MWKGRASVTFLTSSNPQKTQVTVRTEEGPSPVQRAPGHRHCSPFIANGTPPCSLTVAVSFREGWAFPSPGGKFRSKSAVLKFELCQNQPEGLLNAPGGWASQFLIPVGLESLQMSR